MVTVTKREQAALFEGSELCRPAHAHLIGAWYGDLRDIEHSPWWKYVTASAFLSPNYLKRRTCRVKISRAHSDPRLFVTTVDTPGLRLSGDLLVVRATPEKFLSFRVATSDMVLAVSQGIAWARKLRSVDPSDNEADRVVLTLGLEVGSGGWFLQLRVGGQHTPGIWYVPVQSLPEVEAARRLASRRPEAA